VFFVELDPANIDGVRALGTFSRFECHFIAFVKLVELHSLKLVRVEKEIFFLSLASNEAKSAVG